MKKILTLFAILCFGNLMSQSSKDHLRDFKIILDMMDSAKKVNYIRFSMKALERVEFGYSTANTKVKLQMYPRKSYLINVDKKLEVLYNEGELHNKCLVKPHVFPYITLTLDPKGNLMRKNQHFTVHELGFEYTVRTIVVALSKEKENISKHLTYAGKAIKNKMNCHVLVYENLSFGYNDYIVKDRETVTSIANQFIVNDYMIRTRNKLYDEYGYLKKGSVIKIPNYYCKKAIFYIDEATMLPVSMSIFDEVGLFESYEYYDIELHKPIPQEEFKRSYKDYRF